ncbi:MAG: methylated-DNA--[protein]-cysteine S-methyltransferase [Actinomycetes bacterium]
MTVYTTMPSPIGELLLTGDGAALTRLHMSPFAIETTWERDDDALADYVGQLQDYFAGTRRDFDIPLAPAGTPFQQRVWAALLEIPYAETRSYLQLATRIGNAKACRAVGLANGRNPIAVVVPCHRVIGANGSLTGYGGGMDRKRVLLDLERRTSGAQLELA